MIMLPVRVTPAQAAKIVAMTKRELRRVQLRANRAPVPRSTGRGDANQATAAMLSDIIYWFEEALITAPLEESKR